MNTLEAMIKDLGDFTVDEKTVKSPQFRLDLYTNPDKINDMVDEQYSFTCVEENTNNFRHYEMVGTNDSKTFTRLAMCLFNDGQAFNTVIFGYVKGKKVWAPIMTMYVSEWMEYNLLLEIQMHLANRCYDWLDEMFDDDDEPKKKKKKK